MDDDEHYQRTSANDTDNPSNYRRDPTPEKELEDDINNLSLEDSPAGPVVRIPDNQVGTIPDSQPIITSPFSNDTANHIMLQITSKTITKSASDSYISLSTSPPTSLIKPSRLMLKPVTRMSRTDNNNQGQATSPGNISDNDTPYTSATEVTADKSKGAIPKRLPTNNSKTADIIKVADRSRYS